LDDAVNSNDDRAFAYLLISKSCLGLHGNSSAEKAFEASEISMSDVGCRMSDFPMETADFRLQVSHRVTASVCADFGLRFRDFRRIIAESILITASLPVV
jgi:hypothetical protein